jgi:hypothetical protein
MLHSTSQPGLDADPVPPTFHSPLALRFLDEWDRLGRSPAATCEIRGWSAFTAAAASPRPLDEILRRCGFLQPNAEPTDRAMLELVRLAQDSELAARIALQRILPALVAIARRRGRLTGDPQRAFDDVTASAWIAIRGYPLERRPRKVVANLVRDAEYLAFVQARRLMWAGEHVGIPAHCGEGRAAIDGRAESTPAGAFNEVVELLATARERGVAAGDVEFASAWVNGAGTIELARRFHCCERTVRNRRREVVGRLRQVVLAA